MNPVIAVAEECDRAGQRWLRLRCREGLVAAWRSGLARRWRDRYPCLFDEDDLALANRQGRHQGGTFHLVEWVAAIHLHEVHGVRAVIGKWKAAGLGVRGFRKYPRKCELVSCHIGLQTYIDICQRLKGAGPDLFLYGSASERPWFAEVKREDRLNCNQIKDFEMIRKILGREVQLIRVQVKT
jgi:hypothetical protein